MDPLRIGILGAAAIAPEAVIRPAAQAGAQVVAVAARDRGRAHAFAEAHGIPHVSDNYGALVRRPDIDAVYIPLPPAMHEDWLIAAVENRKHVLVEKPFSLNAHQAMWMRELAKRHEVVVFEAFHDRWHPLFQRVQALISQGRIGRLRSIEALFDAQVPKGPDELRYDFALGGGALMDLGTYCVHWCRLLTGEEPQVVDASRRMAPSGVDLATRARLAFPSGVSAEIACDMDAPFRARLEVVGEAGRLIVENPVLPQNGHELVLESGGERVVETLTREPTYLFQLREFVAACRAGRPRPAELGDAVRQMAALDAIAVFGRESLADSRPLRRFQPSAADLSARVWRFGPQDRQAYSDYVTLLDDGRIGGHRADMERRWAIEEGRLVFFDWLDRRSTVFDETRVLPDGRLALTGPICGAVDGSRHQLTERDPLGRLCPAEHGVRFDVQPARRRRNLVIVRADESSLHTGWTRNIADADRNWDLCISWYGAPEGLASLDFGEWRVLQNQERKFTAAYRLCYEGSPVLDYDYVALFDDDLAIHWSGLNELFALTREYGLELAQPSLAPEGHIAYDITRQQSECLLRFVSFVETMCPVFSSRALRVCATTFDGAHSGFGLDNVWPKLLSEPRNRIAIIDKVSVAHTRPTGGNYSLNRAIAEGNETQRRYGAPSKVLQYGAICR